MFLRNDDCVRSWANKSDAMPCLTAPHADYKMFSVHLMWGEADWVTSSCSERAVWARESYLFQSQPRSRQSNYQHCYPTLRLSALSELTTRTTFRNDTSRCYRRGRAHLNRNSQMVSTLVFFWSEHPCITVSWCSVLFQPPPPRYCLAPHWSPCSSVKPESSLLSFILNISSHTAYCLPACNCSLRWGCMNY